MSLLAEPLPLDQRQKAAIVVRFLLSDGMLPPLSSLPEDAQVGLTREMARLGVVDRATLDAVLSEFADVLESVGFAAPRGEDAALAVLSGHISPAAVARIKAEAALRAGADPWSALGGLPVGDLATLLTRESEEVASVALSKLPVAKAAEVLARLPGPLARRVTFAVSRTAKVAPETVARIGRALAEDYCTAPLPAFPEPPPVRLGAILNSAAPATRDEVLGGLEAEDSAFAAEVRRTIFTFRHLPARVRGVDVPKVLRPVEPRTIALALAAAEKAGGDDAQAAEFVLASIPQRLADSVREEMRLFERIKPAEAEAAQAAIIAAVRERADSGEIELRDEEDAA